MRLSKGVDLGLRFSRIAPLPRLAKSSCIAVQILERLLAE
jgi:hypothetical protein